MTDKKDLRKNLNICMLLTLLLCVLAVVPLFAPQEDWRLNAAIFGGQVVLLLPMLYYAKAVLRRGRHLLFGGVPVLPWKGWHLQPVRRGLLAVSQLA